MVRYRKGGRVSQRLENIPREGHSSGLGLCQKSMHNSGIDPPLVMYAHFSGRSVAKANGPDNFHGPVGRGDRRFWGHGRFDSACMIPPAETAIFG